MENLYEKNGLIFWSEEEIQTRSMLQQYFVRQIKSCLRGLNRAFEVFQVEAPLLTPRKLLNKNYTDEQVYAVDRPSAENPIWDNIILRPETTMGSYAYAQHLLSTHKKIRLPICVWQVGKSFRREQDQPTKFMRLKEFYQLEFQVLYSSSTMNDYSETLMPATAQMIAMMLGECSREPSDRVPDYAEWTWDVVCGGMELCSMSLRKDYPDDDVKNFEIAIGLDRCVCKFLEKE